MIRTVVYQGDNLLGDVEIYPQHQQNNNLNSNPDLNGSKAAAVLDHLIREKRIRVNNFSQPSERCPPLAVLYTIGTADLCLKMESNDYDRHTKTTPLGALHSTCLRENKVTSSPPPPSKEIISTGISTTNSNSIRNEPSMQELQAAIAKAAELRAIHAALMQANSRTHSKLFPSS